MATYKKDTFTFDQLLVIAKGEKQGLSPSQVALYAKPCYTPDQMEVLRMGLRMGFSEETVSLYADEAFSSEEMLQIFYGLACGLAPSEVKLYANKNYDWKQMQEIRYALEEGFSFDELASLLDPEKSWAVMGRERMQMLVKRGEEESSQNLGDTMYRTHKDKEAPMEKKEFDVEAFKKKYKGFEDVDFSQFDLHPAMNPDAVYTLLFHWDNEEARVFRDGEEHEDLETRRQAYFKEFSEWKAQLEAEEELKRNDPKAYEELMAQRQREIEERRRKQVEEDRRRAKLQEEAERRRQQEEEEDRRWLEELKKNDPQKYEEEMQRRIEAQTIPF